MNTFQTTPDMVGKYINRYLWTDVTPVGKIVGIKSKTIVLVQRVKPSENKTKMEYLVGGFSAHCPNNTQQSYEFTETEEVFEMRLSKSMMRQFKIDDKPHNYYDYNF